MAFFVLDVFLGIFTPVMNSADMIQHMVFTTELLTAPWALVIPDLFMDHFNVPKKIHSLAAPKVAFVTLLVLNMLVYSLDMIFQYKYFACGIIAHGAFEVSSFFVDNLHMFA